MDCASDWVSCQHWGELRLGHEAVISNTLLSYRSASRKGRIVRAFIMVGRLCTYCVEVMLESGLQEADGAMYGKRRAAETKQGMCASWRGMAGRR